MFLKSGFKATRRVIVEVRDNTVNCNVTNTGTYTFEGVVGQQFTLTNTVSIDTNTGYLKMGIVNSTYSDSNIQTQTINQNTGVVTTTITIPANDVLDATIDINAGALVRNGLAMYFDPAETTSYSGSGTTLNNIAPPEFHNGITATLDSAAMYTGGDTPYFFVRADQDTGSVQRIEFSSNAAHVPGGSTLSIFWWSDYDPQANNNYSNSVTFHAQNKYVNYMGANRTTSATSWSVEAETNGAGVGGNHDYFATGGGIGFNIGDWNEWTSVFNNNTASNWYNGTEHGSTFALGPDSELTLSRIGSNQTQSTSSNPQRTGNFRIGRYMLYNRALTDAEVRANRLVFESLYGSYS